MPAKRFLESSGALSRFLLVCGAIAGLLFTVAWLVEGVTRTDYDPLRIRSVLWR